MYTSTWKTLFSFHSPCVKCKRAKESRSKMSAEAYDERARGGSTSAIACQPQGARFDAFDQLLASEPAIDEVAFVPGPLHAGLFEGHDADGGVRVVPLPPLEVGIICAPQGRQPSMSRRCPSYWPTAALHGSRAAWRGCPWRRRRRPPLKPKGRTRAAARTELACASLPHRWSELHGVGRPPAPVVCWLAAP